jgi:hypothetical protein
LNAVVLTCSADSQPRAAARSDSMVRIRARPCKLQPSSHRVHTKHALCPLPTFVDTRAHNYTTYTFGETS